MSKTIEAEIEAEIGEIKIPIVVKDFEKFINFVQEGNEDSTKGICNFKNAEKKCYLGKGAFGVVSRLCCLEDRKTKIAVKIIDTTGQTKAAIAEVEKEKDVNTALFKGPKKEMICIGVADHTRCIKSEEGKDNIVKYYGSIDAQTILTIGIKKKLLDPNTILGIENKSLMFFGICNSGDLREKKNIEFAFKKDNFKDCCLQICKGLQFIHNCGYDHGDLALRNIFVHSIEKENKYKIGDFGLSTKMDNKMVEYKTKMSIPRESPPDIIDEKFKLKEFNAVKRDIFHLGILFFQLLNFDFNKDYEYVRPNILGSPYKTELFDTNGGLILEKVPAFGNIKSETKEYFIFKLAKAMTNKSIEKRPDIINVINEIDPSSISAAPPASSISAASAASPIPPASAASPIPPASAASPMPPASAASSMSPASAASSISPASAASPMPPASAASPKPPASAASGTGSSDALRKRDMIIGLTEKVVLSTSTIKGGNRKKKKSKKGNKKKRKINRK